jgi:prepilin peptidase CpaA
MMASPPLSAWLLLAWAAAIAYSDLRSRRIPNVMSLGAWLAALTVLVLTGCSVLGYGWQDVMRATGLAFALTLPAYALKWLGAGDVKMLVAIALMTSFDITLHTALLAGLAGGAVGAVWLLLDQARKFMPLLTGHARFDRWLGLHSGQRRMAYGALYALALACSLVMEYTR